MLKEKISIGLAYFMQFLILVFIVIAATRGRYLSIIEGTLCFIVTFLPLILKRKWKITLPWTINFLIVFSLYIHYSGQVLGLYNNFPIPYDDLTHFIGSGTVALLGFALAIVFEKYTRAKLRKNHIVLFIIIFTLAFGVMWELTEFAVDNIFGTFTQRGLDDTMIDLIFDLIGGIFIALIVITKIETIKPKIVLEK
jgi:hypothetical protein